VQLFGPGDTDVGVFDTPIGRIALIICYDDTYWQDDRLAALRGAKIIGWHSVSDRVMPGTPPAQAKGNHSTVASVQHMSALNGVWVIGATRSGIERNPINGSQFTYKRMAARRPSLYNPLLALRRAPVDTTATDLAVTERTGLYQSLRTDVLAVPSGDPAALKMEIDPRLYAVSDTPTLTTAAGADAVRHRTVVPAPGTWINQQQLIDEQRNDLFRPLVLDSGNACFQRWKRAGHGLVGCP
jgi:hypothetical protein